MRPKLLFCTVLIFMSCGQLTRPETSQESALVSKHQADAAFQIVKAIDYLPFTFIVDGCYARSLFMSLELAAQGIPSSAHYVFGNLQPTASISWSYHVAPLLQLKDSEQEPWILDPAFEKEPLSRTKWVSKNFAKSQAPVKDTVEGTWTQTRAGSAYFDETGRAAQYDTDETLLFDTESHSKDPSALVIKPLDPSILVPDFADLPNFLASDIHEACTVMWGYIGLEDTISLVQKAKKRVRLLERTRELSQAMDKLGKLTRDKILDTAGPGSTDCRATLVP